jgi:hypothetical protein
MTHQIEHTANSNSSPADVVDAWAKVAEDMFSNPAEILQEMKNVFHKIDDDKSQGLSTLELKEFVRNSDASDRSKAAAAVCLKRFDEVVTLANEKEKFRYIHDNYGSRGITAQDLTAGLTSLNGGDVNEIVSAVRSSEIKRGAMVGALGLGMGGASVLAFMAPDPVLSKMVGTTTAATSLFTLGLAGNLLFNSKAPGLRQSFEARKAMLESWKSPN